MKQGGLGFQTPPAFKKALVAKQAGPLLSVPDSLVARLYKARYHSSSLLDINLRFQPMCNMEKHHGFHGCEQKRHSVDCGQRRKDTCVGGSVAPYCNELPPIHCTTRIPKGVKGLLALL